MLGTDLGPFFQSAHFAQTAVWGGVSALGILDQPGDVLHDGEIVSTDYTLLVKSSDFVGIKFGDAITVGGVPYAVRYPRQLDDGALTMIVLSKA